MTFNKTIRRELQVAFSRKSQSIPFRIVKYVVIAVLIYFLRDSKLFWIVFSLLFVCALGLHFWVRYKTRGWTRSYGLWEYDGEGEG